MTYDFNKKKSSNKNFNSKNQNQKKYTLNKENNDNKENKTNKKTNQSNSYNKFNKKTEKTNIFQKNNKNKIQNNTYNQNFKTQKNNQFKINNSNKDNNFFEIKYDSIFGKGTFFKLLKEQRELKNNQFIRINLSKTSKDNVINFLNKNRVKYSQTFLENCLKIEKSFFSLSSAYPSLTGQIYLQDLASQVVINSIGFEELKKLNKKITILDMCSSPGSKTTQLSDKLKFLNIEHEIIALEPQEKRIQKLINNIQKQNCENIKIFQTTAQEFNSSKTFDLIIVDAPCSGNLIGDSNWLKKRNQKGIEENSKIQKEILNKVKKLANKNSQIIYSTCSLEIEENEENIEYAIKKLNLKTESIKLKIPFNTNPIIKYNNKTYDKQILNAIRFMPYESKTEGFFICKLKL